MNWQKYQLDEVISKTTEDMTLWQSEKGIVEVNKDTLAIAVKQDDEVCGYVFHGHGRLLLDTIVETNEGALGKSVERELNKPFLMLGKIGETKSLAKASREDVQEFGYESEHGFITNSRETFHKFLEKRHCCSCHSLGSDGGFIFAFLNDDDKLDVLLAKGSRLIYKAMGMVFIANDDKAILKGSGEVVLSHSGKSLFIRK